MPTDHFTSIIHATDSTATPALNPVQLAAVRHPGGPLLILAGAGSGKTRVLTERIAYLILERGISPHAILAFTFTNKAANEMRTRVASRLGGEPYDLWIGTFHKICTRILRRHGDVSGWPRTFVIYDTEDTHGVLKRVIEDLHLPEAQYRPSAVARMISDAKNRLVEPPDFAATAVAPFNQGVARVYAEYQRRLRQQGALDFDDIIQQTLVLFREHPEVLERYTSRFEHVLVDEYQDTNHAQYKLITALASGRRNLVVVGDDDQAIYSWRGADITNILSFEETYPEATVLRLEQNYRSTQKILGVAHAVVQRNMARRDKKLWTENHAGEQVHLLLATDEEAEGQIVADLVEDLRTRHGLQRGGILVLYRTHAQSRALEDGLRRAAIPYELVGGVAFYERREVKDVLAYLRLLMNPHDDVSFLRIVNVPRRGIGEATLLRLRALAIERGLSLLETLAVPDALHSLGQTAKRLAGFRDLIAELTRSQSLPVPELVRLVLERSGYLQALIAEGEESLPRLENVEELVAAAAHAVEETGDESLEGFLAEASLMSHVDAYAGDMDRIVLMTVHNAKGLEFPAVIVTGLEEGLFPHMSAFDDPREMEEERRLFYVAVTRAERVVYLLSAGERRRYDRRLPSRLSRFVEEIPEDMLDVEDRGVRRWARRWYAEPPARSSRATVRRSAEPGATHYDDGAPEVGEEVAHRTFGRGVVVEKQGLGEEARLLIQFASVGRKKIVARFVRRLDHLASD
jgi:DNA helicase-2/ATP-dependent DNA helicase PcrA